MRKIALWLFLGWVALRILVADGGTVQFQRQAGPFFVTVFGAPIPLRVGLADLTVMVQKADNRSDVLDCDVRLHLSKPGAQDISVAATRAQGTNKLLYAAHPLLQQPGKWNLSVEIKGRGDTAHVNGYVAVLPQLPPVIAYWPYFAVVPVGVAVFAVNQWLKSVRNLRNPRARP